MSLNNAPLSEVLAELSKATGITFTVATDQFDAKGIMNIADLKIKSVEAKDALAAKVLFDVVNQAGARFMFTKDGITIVPK